MQGICDKAADIIEPEGRQHDLLEPRSGIANRLKVRKAGERGRPRCPGRRRLEAGGAPQGA